MKKFLCLISIAAVFSSDAWAGGAAAVRMQGQRQRQIQVQEIQQRQIQQQMIQQQMIQRQVQIEAAKKMGEEAAKEVVRQRIANDSAQVREIATLDDVIASLDQSSRAWELIIDEQAKEAVISYYIDAYRRQGVKIRQPPSHYAGMIDGMSQGSPQMLEQPFGSILRVAAIIEYDFDNGTSKDNMALEILGPQNFQQNRERIRQQYGY